MKIKDLIKVGPSLPVTDLWYKPLTPMQLAAYKICIECGMIKIQKVVTDPVTKQTCIKYLSTIPEEWIHETLKDAMIGNFKRYEEVNRQMSMKDL